MRVAIIGSGGVGGYFGGRLAEGGHDVAFVARGRHLEAMRAHGLRVDSAAGDFRLERVNATERTEDIGPVDVVLVCVKTWQVVEVADRLAPLLGPATVVVPLQNGVEAAAQLQARVGRDRVLGGIARIIAFVAGPGHIQHLGADPVIELGELAGPPTPRVAELVAALSALRGVTARAVDDMQAALWLKLMFVAGWGAVAVLARVPIGPLRSVPATRALLVESMAEIERVAIARGVALPPGRIEAHLRYIDALPPDGTVSLQRDLAAGAPSEIEAWSGAVVRLGHEVGVDAPIHRIAHAAVQPAEQRARGVIVF